MTLQAPTINNSTTKSLPLHLRRLLSSKVQSLCIIQDGLFCTTIFAATRLTGESVAVKLISKSQNKENLQLDEATILGSLSHPHIISLTELYETFDYTVMLTPLASLGDLHSFINNCTIVERSARDISSQLLCALAYIHSSGIIHCDIRPRNLLVFEHKSLFIIKICDFGSAVILKDGLMTRKFVAGSSQYLAPELLLREPFEHSIDVFAAGVLIFRLIGGYDPIQHSRESKRLFPRGDFDLEFPGSCWGHVSDACKFFLQKCMWGISKGRLRASEALHCEWLKPGFQFPGNFFSPTLPPNPLINFWPAELLFPGLRFFNLHAKMSFLPENISRGRKIQIANPETWALTAWNL